MVLGKYVRFRRLRPQLAHKVETLVPRISAQGNRHLIGASVKLGLPCGEDGAPTHQIQGCV